MKGNEMTETTQSVFTPNTFFPTTVYTIVKPEFLESVNLASNDALDLAKKQHTMNETYPVVMSTGMMGDPRIKDFQQFIAQSGWAILDAQGYDMTKFNTYVSELWCQEHHKFSGMEEHVHPYGVLLSGFYFLETPEESSMIHLHDPRAGKVQASLPEKDNTKVTEASNSFYMKPEPGMMIISNSWLPHSFTRNASDKPCKFIHFNISIVPAPQSTVEGPVIV
jgi:uncharacterized protein (TIGR02466 family)